MSLKSHGVILEVGDGATPSEVFAAIADIGDLDEATVNREVETITSHSSQGVEVVPVGVPDYGEISFQVPHSAAPALRGLVETGAKKNWKIKTPGASGTLETMSFAGYVTSYGVPYTVNGVQMANVTIRISGKPTFA